MNLLELPPLLPHPPFRDFLRRSCCARVLSKGANRMATTKTKDTIERYRGRPSDSWFLRKELQDHKLSVPTLADKINELTPQLAKRYKKISPNRVFSEERLYAMLREEGRFDKETYVLVAAALDLDDWESLTRRNRIVDFHLEADEHNARVALGRIIARRDLPARLYDQQECVYAYLMDASAHGRLPSALRDSDLKPSGLRRIVESLCPAGHLVRRGRRFLIDRLSTERMLRRCKSRQRRLREANEDLFDPDYSSLERRRAIGQILDDGIRRFEDANTDDKYIAIDLDWQLELASGADFVIYLNMLDLVRSCRQTMDFLIARHLQEDLLPRFDSDFRLPRPDWWKKWTTYNTEAVKHLSELLKHRSTGHEHLTRVTDLVVEQTIVNVKAVDNALERHRTDGRGKVRYRNLKWQLATEWQL